MKNHDIKITITCMLTLSVPITSSHGYALKYSEQPRLEAVDNVAGIVLAFERLVGNTLKKVVLLSCLCHDYRRVESCAHLGCMPEVSPREREDFYMVLRLWHFCRTHG